MEEIINSYLKNFFTPSDVSKDDMEVVLSKVEPKISQEMNNLLESDFTKEDVINVIKNLNPSKPQGRMASLLPSIKNFGV